MEPLFLVHLGQKFKVTIHICFTSSILLGQIWTLLQAGIGVRRMYATCVCIESPDDDEGDMWHDGSQLGAQTYMTRDIITLSLIREVLSDERVNNHRD